MLVSAQHERLKALLSEAVTVLCKNGLKYQNELCIEGLIGITVDKDSVLLVNIKETMHILNESTNTDADSDAEGMVLHDDNNQTFSVYSSKTDLNTPRKSNSRSTPSKTFSVVSTSVSSDHDADNMDSSEVAYAIPDIKCEPPDEDDLIIIKEENISDNHDNSNIHQNDDDNRFEDYAEDMTHHYQTYTDNSEQEARLGHSTLSGSSSTIPVLSIPQHSRSTFSNLTRPTFSNLARPTFSSLTRYNGNKSLTPSKFNKNSKKASSRFSSGTGGLSSSRNSQSKSALVCQHCNSTFGQKSTYYRHIREKHTMGKTFRCKFCSKLFQSSDTRRTHIAAEHKQFKYNCEICNARFNFQNKLALHKLKFHAIYHS